jgi:hypothetical protein
MLDTLLRIIDMYALFFERRSLKIRAISTGAFILKKDSYLFSMVCADLKNVRMGSVYGYRNRARLVKTKRTLVSKLSVLEREIDIS